VTQSIGTDPIPQAAPVVTQSIGTDPIPQAAPVVTQSIGTDPIPQAAPVVTQSIGTDPITANTTSQGTQTRQNRSQSVGTQTSVVTQTGGTVTIRTSEQGTDPINPSSRSVETQTGGVVTDGRPIVVSRGTDPMEESRGRNELLQPAHQDPRSTATYTESGVQSNVVSRANQTVGERYLVLPPGEGRVYADDLVYEDEENEAYQTIREYRNYLNATPEEEIMLDTVRDTIARLRHRLERTSYSRERNLFHFTEYVIDVLNNVYDNISQRDELLDGAILFIRHSDLLTDEQRAGLLRYLERLQSPPPYEAPPPTYPGPPTDGPPMYYPGAFGQLRIGSGVERVERRRRRTPQPYYGNLDRLRRMRVRRMRHAQPNNVMDIDVIPPQPPRARRRRRGSMEITAEEGEEFLRRSIRPYQRRRPNPPSQQPRTSQRTRQTRRRRR
jgi:hypothetical protein